MRLFAYLRINCWFFIHTLHIVYSRGGGGGDDGQFRISRGRGVVRYPSKPKMGFFFKFPSKRVGFLNILQKAHNQQNITDRRKIFIKNEVFKPITCENSRITSKKLRKNKIFSGFKHHPEKNFSAKFYCFPVANIVQGEADACERRCGAHLASAFSA